MKLTHSVVKFVLEVWLHEGVAVFYASLPGWAKIVFWGCGAGLGFALLSRLLLHKQKELPVRVTVDDTIYEGTSEVVNLIRVETGHEPPKNGTIQRHTRRR